MTYEYYSDRQAYKKWKRRKFREQKLMGIGMLAMNMLVPTGAAVLFIPMALWMICSKQILIY